MVFEHFALNVADPLGMRDWYCSHLGMKVVFQMEEAPFMLFLADSSGRVVCELYHNPAGAVRDFSQEHHLTFHFAFVTEAAVADRDRLLTAGCTLIEQIDSERHQLVMLRDPWGLPLQLCQRNYTFDL